MMSVDAPESKGVARLRAWFASRGGWVHPSVRFHHHREYGLAAFSTSPIPASSPLVVLPTSLAITPRSSKHALDALFPESRGSGPSTEVLDDRVAAVTYVALHDIVLGTWVDGGGGEDGERIDEDGRGHKRPRLDGAAPFSLLSHHPYTSLLPDTHYTALHFTRGELALLRGTNLHGATICRREQMEEEWAGARKWLEARAATEEQKGWVGRRGDGDGDGDGDGFTLEAYMRASSAFSSRAFPSRVVTGEGLTGAKEGGGGEVVPEVVVGGVEAMETSSEESGRDERQGDYPVLLPVLDILNHRRGEKVSWVHGPLTRPVVDAVGDVRPPSNDDPTEATAPSSGATAVTLISHAAHTIRGSQLYNNYGLKSNEELLLGYGFVLDPNPDDWVVLRLGSMEEEKEKGGEEVSGGPSSRWALFSALGLRAGRRHFLRRDAEPPAPLLCELRLMLASAVEQTAFLRRADREPWRRSSDGAAEKLSAGDLKVVWEEGEWEEGEEMQLEGNVLETLEEMFAAKLVAVEGEGEGGEVREEVTMMIDVYRRGQADILRGALKWTEAKMDELIEEMERVGWS